MKKRLILGGLLFVLMGFTGCQEKQEIRNVSALLEPVGVQIDVAEVQKSDMFMINTYKAEVVPYMEELQFEVDGVFESMEVAVGDMVEEGQLLAYLNEENVTEQIEQLKKDIEYINAMGVYSDKQDELDIRIAETELEQQREAGASAQTCKLKEVDIEKLKLNLEQSRELRNLELQNKKAKLQELLKKQGNSQIVAPFSGRVVYVRNLKKGNSVQGFSTIICIVDETRLEISSEYISESSLVNADRLYTKIMDNEYDITYKPYDKDEYISLILAGEEVKTYFTLDNPDANLESGLFASVVLYSTYKENVLNIPANSIYMEGSTKYVYKIVDNQRVRCDVTVGLTTDARVEILEGLEEGDIVYVKE